MNALDLPDLARGLLPAVLEAGRVEMQYFRTGAAVEKKTDNSPVTAADREAEEIILDYLHRVAPGTPVVAEERTAAHGLPEVGDAYFLVDPLDGTKEFVADRDEFTINVALIKGTRPVFGLIYAPAREQLFVTLAPDRAVECSVAPTAACADFKSLQVQTLKCREPNPNALVALQSRSHREPAEAFLNKLGVRQCVRLGSSLKFCLLARGEGDLYPRFGPTSQWDTAAGHAILNAAGGCITTLSGKALGYGRTRDKFINPQFVAWASKSLISRH